MVEAGKTAIDRVVRKFVVRYGFNQACNEGIKQVVRDHFDIKPTNLLNTGDFVLIERAIKNIPAVQKAQLRHRSDHVVKK